jgi:hypothetical protein
MIKKSLHNIEKYTRDTEQYMGNKSRSILAQYPILFTFLVLFGAIATLKGFEEVIVRIPLFDQYPLLLFFIGILILIFTGSLFKILQKHKLDD